MNILSISTLAFLLVSSVSADHSYLRFSERRTMMNGGMMMMMMNGRRRRRGGRNNGRRNICPATLPTEGSACRRRPRLDPCGYDYAAIPLATSETDATCNGDVSCQPTTQCSCIGRRWVCNEVENTDVCEGELPELAFQDCVRTDGVFVPVDNDTVSDLEQEEEVEQWTDQIQTKIDDLDRTCRSIC